MRWHCSARQLIRNARLRQPFLARQVLTHDVGIAAMPAKPPPATPPARRAASPAAACGNSPSPRPPDSAAPSADCTPALSLSDAHPNPTPSAAASLRPTPGPGTFPPDVLTLGVGSTLKTSIVGGALDSVLPNDFTGTWSEWVYSDTTNPFGAGDLSGHETRHPSRAEHWRERPRDP